MDEHRDRGDAPPDLDHLQAGLVLLMDRYVEAPCPGIAAAVTGQLEAIVQHPLVDLFPRLQRQCAQRLNRWRLRASAAPRGHAAEASLTRH